MVSSPAYAQSNLPSDIRVFSIRGIYSQSLIGQEIQSRLEAVLEDLRDEDQRIEAELSAEEAELAAIRDETDPDEFANMAKAFDRKTEFYREEFDRLERNRQLLEATWNNRLLQIIVRNVEAWAKREGILVVMPSDGLAYADPRIDISPIIIAALDQQYQNNKEPFLDAIFAPIEDLEEFASTDKLRLQLDGKTEGN